jgi:hypothetical protein
MSDGGSSSRTIDVTIRLDKAMAEKADRIVAELKRRGLSDVQAHVRFMIVSGTIAPEHVEGLRSVEGVQSVRQDSTYRTQQ